MIRYLLLFLFITMTGSVSASHFNYNWTYEEDLINSYLKEKKASGYFIDSLEKIYNNSMPYKAYIKYIAKKYDVPEEIIAIPAIESGFRLNVKSHAGAVGMWQIMPLTARDMGLKINKQKDERKQWKKATLAAIKYIKYLAINNFNGDYELAILAYNAGLGNIKSSIKRMKNNNAWFLIKYDKNIPKESKEYLIKFIIYATYFEYMEQKQN